MGTRIISHTATASGLACALLLAGSAILAGGCCTSSVVERVVRDTVQVPVIEAREVQVMRNPTEAEWDTIMCWALNVTYAQYQVDSATIFKPVPPLQQLLTWTGRKVTDRGDSIVVVFRLPRASFDIRVKAADIPLWRVDTVKVTEVTKMNWADKILFLVIGLVVGVIAILLIKFFVK